MSASKADKSKQEPDLRNGVRGEPPKKTAQEAALENKSIFVPAPRRAVPPEFEVSSYRRNPK